MTLLKNHDFYFRFNGKIHKIVAPDEVNARKRASAKLGMPVVLLRNYK